MSTYRPQFGMRVPTNHKMANGPVAVYGEDSIVTLENLPQTYDCRWTWKKKSKVAAAVLGGLLSVDDACVRYHALPQEIQLWCSTATEKGARRLGRMQETAMVADAFYAFLFAAEMPRVFIVGDITIDTHTGYIFGVERAALHGVRLQMLALLAAWHGHVLTRGMFLKYLHQDGLLPSRKVIDVHVYYLRQIVGRLSRTSSIVEVWGRGYMLL